LRIAAPAAPVAPPAPPAPAPAPAAAPTPTPIAASALETLLLREKLITPDQMAQAMTEQVQTGKSMETIVRESGWVSEADLARLLEHVSPNAQPTPAVVAAPTVAPVAVLETQVQVQVTLRLTNGERIAVATFDGEAAAKAYALELTREFAASQDWPFVDGRYVRPEAVVSVDITAV
jgi:hypothetical protein